MKLKNKLLSAVLSAVLMTGSAGAAAVTMDAVSVSASAAAAKVLEGPSSLTASKEATNYVTLKWSKVKGASSYRIYSYNMEKGGFEKVADSAKTTYKVTGLKDASVFNFKVAALKKSGGSYIEHGESKVLVAHTKSSDPAAVRNTGSDSSIVLKAQDKLPVEAGYYSSKKWNSLNRIDDYTYQVSGSDSKTLKISLKGEVIDWNGETGGYSFISVTLYDSEGYSVKSDTASRTINSKGKFKDMSVRFYNLEPGTYSFTVSDYGYGDKPRSADEPEDKLNGCTIDLPTLPREISSLNYKGLRTSTCEVTGISCEVSGSKLTLYFSGKKTYDVNGSGQSAACKIGWKLYETTDSGELVVDAGTCYTLAIKEGELFKDKACYSYGKMEQGHLYRLEIMDVN